MSPGPRVVIAGLFHETHTFLPGRTPLAEFQQRRGAELLAAAGDGSPLAGALETARELGWDVVPAIDLRATPSATADDAVVETFSCALDATLSTAGRVDGVFLVLHGAMVSASFRDVEGEILARLARRLGDRPVPVGGVFDLHANFTAAMAAHSQALVAYRCNPHTDAHEAAVRAARLFDRLLHGVRAVTVWERPALIWPPSGVATADEPMRSLLGEARRIEDAFPEILAVNVLAGFAFADTPDTGVSFTAITTGAADRARDALRGLAREAVSRRQEGYIVPPPIESILPELRRHETGPVLVVEPADNIGGGAPGDATGVLEFFLRHRLPSAAVCLNDPRAVAEARRRRLGERFTLEVGAASGPISGRPQRLDVELRSTSDGRFTLEDPHSHLASMCGLHIDMGPCATLLCGGLTLLLTSQKTPPFDLGQWRSQGIEPRSLRYIGVKAAVAHRQAYDPIAVASYTVDTPGACTSNLRQLPFQRVRRPVFPLEELGLGAAAGRKPGAK